MAKENERTELEGGNKKSSNDQKENAIIAGLAVILLLVCIMNAYYCGKADGSKTGTEVYYNSGFDAGYDAGRTVEKFNTILSESN